MIAESKVFTHGQLVQRAIAWLRNGAAMPPSWGGFARPLDRRTKCRVALAEARGNTVEIPDAIGWAWGGRVSLVVECKVSRSDFLADAKKLFRKHSDWGMGQYRYFMAPAGLIAFDEVPENWGLLELKSPTGRIAVTRVALPQKHNQSAELGAMFQAMSCLTWNSEIALDRIRAGVSVGDECESVQFRPDEL